MLPRANGPGPVFHEGERALQAEVGMAERMGEVGQKVIRDYMPEQHRELFEQLPFMLLGHVDAQGTPQAVLLAGEPGFVAALDPHTLRLRYAYSSDAGGLEHLQQGDAVGLLGLQPHTRRRNRANGYVVAHAGRELVVRVLQSYGNCPKYITPREVRFTARNLSSAIGEESSMLSRHALGIVRSADTFFIASSASAARDAEGRAYGVDVSHRGGPGGFVAVSEEDGANILSLPDYQGNFFFNTLGNLTLHPKAGLLFPVFESGDVLSLQTHAELVTTPSGRALRLRVRSGELALGALPLAA